MSVSLKTRQLVRVFVQRLPPALKGKVVGAMLCALVISFSQLAVVGSVSLLGATLSSPETVASSKWMEPVWGILSSDYWGKPDMMLMLIVGACVCSTLANNFLRAFNQYLVVSIGKEVEGFFGTSLMEGFFVMPYKWHLKKNPSDLIAVSTWAARYGAVAASLIVMGGEIFTILLILSSVLFVAPAAALACFGVLFVAGACLFRFVKGRLDFFSASFRDLVLVRARVVYQSILGIKDAKLSGREAGIINQYQDTMHKAVGLTAKQELARATPMYVLEVLGFFMLALAVGYLLSQDVPYVQVAGTVALLAATGWRLLPCVNKLIDAVSSLRINWPFLEKTERYFSEFSRECVVNNDFSNGVSYNPIKSSLALQDVAYSYEKGGQLVLKQVSVTISRGEVVGIVGGSGAGKSTLVNVLCGLLTPTGGGVYLDDRQILEDGIRHWRAGAVGFVHQAPYIFDGTLSENVAYGYSSEEIDQERVLECCRMAAIDFLDDLPDGVHTLIGDRGARLSGGQQQRVAIARALYKKPDVLIFDEATSSLDAKNEKTIQNTINGLKGRLTQIIVAHRLSTITNCDKIVWLQNGTVRMIGEPHLVLPKYRRFLSTADNSGVDFCVHKDREI